MESKPLEKDRDFVIAPKLFAGFLNHPPPTHVAYTLLFLTVSGDVAQQGKNKHGGGRKQNNPVTLPGSLFIDTAFKVLFFLALEKLG